MKIFYFIWFFVYFKLNRGCTGYPDGYRYRILKIAHPANGIIQLYPAGRISGPIITGIRCSSNLNVEYKIQPEIPVRKTQYRYVRY
jgi:hypothetical protein